MKLYLTTASGRHLFLHVEPTGRLDIAAGDREIASIEVEIALADSGAVGDARGQTRWVAPQDLVTDTGAPVSTYADQDEER